MIDRALLFLKDQLNAHFARAGGGAEAGLEDAVVFVDGDKLDPLTLKTGAVNLLLVNLEQENVLRPGDPFARIAADGTRMRVQPEVRLSLWLLFVARFRVYEAGLAALSTVLDYLQQNRVFEAHLNPGLDARIGRLAVELQTLPITEQNDLWSALKLAYHPSLLFKVGLVVVRDAGERAGAPVAEPKLEVAHASPALA